MPTIKTAVSLQKALAAEADVLANELHISRSRLVALALEEYIRRRQNQRLLEQLNEAYAGEPDPAEGRLLAGMRRRQRTAVEGEW